MDSAASVHQSAIDSGREPARTMLQIASAVRQDLAGAGARAFSLDLILKGESIHGPVVLSDEQRVALVDALAGLVDHLNRVERKLALAVEAER